MNLSVCVGRCYGIQDNCWFNAQLFVTCNIISLSLVVNYIDKLIDHHLHLMKCEFGGRVGNETQYKLDEIIKRNGTENSKVSNTKQKQTPRQTENSIH